jgi:IS5 family transposase
MKRSAIKTDLSAGDKRQERRDSLGDPLVFLDRHVDFAALVAEVDRVAPRKVDPNGGRGRRTRQKPWCAS